jgi:hypothetical protein
MTILSECAKNTQEPQRQKLPRKIRTDAVEAKYEALWALHNGKIKPGEAEETKRIGGRSFECGLAPRAFLQGIRFNSAARLDPRLRSMRLSIAKSARLMNSAKI